MKKKKFRQHSENIFLFNLNIYNYYWLKQKALSNFFYPNVDYLLTFSDFGFIIAELLVGTD